jgi:hypothetical protein
MANDAKLGLIVGIGLVISVAMIYFRKDLGPADTPVEAASVTPVSSTRSVPANPPRGTYKSVRAKAVTQEEERDAEGATASTGTENWSANPAARSTSGPESGVRYLPPIDRPDQLP